MAKTANPEPETSTLGELESAFLTAQNARISAEENVLVVAKNNPTITDLQTAMTAADTAKKAEAKAKTAYDTAKFNAENAGRMAAAVDMKDAISEFIANTPAVETAFGMGITSCTITRTEDGTFLVNVNTGVKAPRAASAGGTGTRKGKVAWVKDGAEYTSRQLLETFGGDAGAEALNRVDNWQTLGLKHNPGFDGAVKKLAGEIGAVPAA